MDHATREKHEGHLPKEKNGGQKGRNRGRGRRQNYHGTTGHGNSLKLCNGYFPSIFIHLLKLSFFKILLGHGTQYSNHGIEPSKPPPGPRMPDGTRGFAMGRGRPSATD